jgi:Family of unknown function (DUF6483)
MIETDYIMRLVGQLTALLARLMFLKKAKEFPQALVEINTTEKSLLGVDRDLLRTLSHSQVMTLFGTDENLALPKAYVLGALLKEEADILSREGMPEESAALALKSLDLLTDSYLKSGNTLDPAHEKHLWEALRLLDGRELPVPSRERLFACAEALRRFDMAENLLFELASADRRFYESGMLFYQRLLARSDDDLTGGRLPRQEVEEGMREFERRFKKG